MNLQKKLLPLQLGFFHFVGHLVDHEAIAKRIYWAPVLQDLPYASYFR